MLSVFQDKVILFLVGLRTFQYQLLYKLKILELKLLYHKNKKLRLKSKKYTLPLTLP